MIEKQLRKYIMPNVLAMMGTSCYILADTFFISASEGADGITALNLVLPIYGLIYAIGSMIGIGSATRYSLDRALGTEDYPHYFSNSVFWTLLISLPFVALGIFMPDKVLQFMGADTVILEVGLSYTQIVLCFAPFFMLNYTCTAFVRNDGSPKIAMAATLFSGIFNIIFDYIFMFPMGMGMVGAALATGISPIVSMLICMGHFSSRRNTVRFLVRRPSPKKLVRACQLGVVAFVGEMSSGITTMVFNLILLRLAGNTAVAAYGVIANTALVGTALFNGISQGLQPLASESHGKGDEQGEKRIYRHSLEIAGVFAVVLVLLAVLFAQPLVSVFNSQNSPELEAYAVWGMRLYFVGFLFAFFNIVKAGFCSATGKGKESSVIAVLRGVIAITAFAFLLSGWLGVTGVWLVFPAAELFTLLVSVFGFKKLGGFKEG